MPPTVGTLIRTSRGGARIIAVYPFGTVDVESLDGKRHWRVTGLPFI
jgi:hypothetical protein